MIVRSLSAAACLAAVALAGCGSDDGGSSSSSQASTTPTVAKKPTAITGNGYTFTAPAGWARSQQQGLDAILVRPEKGAKYPINTTVALAPAAKGITVRQAAPVFRAGVKKQGATNIVVLPPLKVDGENAVALRYDRTTANVVVRQQLVSMIRDGQTYSIGLTATPDRFSDANADFKRMLKSWRWS
jgi:hypothetical protein